MARKAKAQKAKAPTAPVNGKPNGKRNGRPTVQAVLHGLFSQATPPPAEEIIEQLAKRTGRTPLSLSTLRLYKAKWQAGAFGCQSEKPKTKLVLQTASK